MPTSYHSGQKRSACDRCREQKLRCKRDDRDESNLQEPCDRCQRLDAKCITSEAKPLGRPRTRILDSGPAVSSPASPMTPETLLSPTMSSSTLDILSLSTSPLPTDDLLIQDLLMASAYPPEPYVLSPDDMTLDSFDPMLSMQDLTLDSGALAAWDLSGGGEISPSKTPSDPSGGLRNSETEAVISLSQLSVDLGRQLAVVHTYHWPELLMQGKLMSDESPVSIIMVKTDHFISVLRRLSPPADVQSPSDELDDFGRTTMDTSFRLTATTYLLILVDYLQIMRVYNAVFEQIVVYFPGQAKEDITSDSEMAIVEVQHASNYNYIKGFTQVVEQYIMAFEQELGLPAGYCVSGRSTNRVGIFSDFSTAGLLGTVMSQGTDEGDFMTGKGLVLALRANLLKVHEMLLDGMGST